MGDYKLNPEKITHPIQLMAGWFVMLLGLETIFLTTAAKIDKPDWAAGFLVIMSAVVALLVMAAVFLMLTKFRPHLQGPKEYAEWLKNERKFGKGIIRTFAIGEVQATATEVKKIAERAATPEIFPQVSTHPISISFLPRYDELIAALTKVGFKASVYEAPFSEPLSKRHLEMPNAHEAIWVGARVPAKVVALAIKTAIEIWPHLKYVHLSSDGDSPPDFVHDEIYLGGSTESAKSSHLKTWTKDELLNLPEDVSLAEFHKIIRSKY